MDQRRDMSDYESALSAAMSVLISAVLDLGGDQDALVERLDAHRDEFKVSGNADAASLIEDLVAYAKESTRAPEFRGGPAPARKARSAKKRAGRASAGAAKKRGGAASTAATKKRASSASKARSASSKTAKGRRRSR
jgi:hypothetical protein